MPSRRERREAERKLQKERQKQQKAAVPDVSRRKLLSSIASAFGKAANAAKTEATTFTPVPISRKSFVKRVAAAAAVVGTAGAGIHLSTRPHKSQTRLKIIFTSHAGQQAATAFLSKIDEMAVSGRRPGFLIMENSRLFASERMVAEKNFNDFIARLRAKYRDNLARRDYQPIVDGIYATQSKLNPSERVFATSMYFAAVKYGMKIKFAEEYSRKEADELGRFDADRKLLSVDEFNTPTEVVGKNISAGLEGAEKFIGLRNKAISRTLKKLPAELVREKLVDEGNLVDAAVMLGLHHSDVPKIVGKDRDLEVDADLFNPLGSDMPPQVATHCLLNENKALNSNETKLRVTVASFVRRTYRMYYRTSPAKARMLFDKIKVLPPAECKRIISEISGLTGQARVAKVESMLGVQ